MKRFISTLAAITVTALAQSQTISFTVTNMSGSNSITCVHQSLNFTASSSNTTLTYLWMGPNSSSLSGGNVSINTAGSWTVSAFSGTSSVNQVLTIGINTTVPASALTPTLQSITCNPSSVSTVSLSTSAGMLQKVYSPLGGVFISGAQNEYYAPGSPGTYSYTVEDPSNGCITIKNFSVTSTQGFPTYSLVSPQNFTLGCTTKSVVVINIINASTFPVPGGPVSYTLMGTPNSSYSLNVAGTWTAIVRDNTNFCESRTPFTILAPAPSNVNVTYPINILDCNISQVALTGSSQTPNTSYMWLVPGSPGSVPGNAVLVSANTAVPSSSIVGNYTFVVTENNSTCETATVVQVYQNLYPPHAAIASGANGILTCSTSSIVLNNISTTGIPPSAGFPTNQPVVGEFWLSPAGQPTLAMSTSYTAQAAGTYTLIVKDMNNGCESFTTTTIQDQTDFPVVNNPVAPAPSCLTGGSATLSPIITTPSANLTYSWSGPSGANMVGLTSATLTTNTVGIYTITVTSSQGCKTSAVQAVANCAGIVANGSPVSLSIFPNPGKGVYSLTVSNPDEAVIEIYNTLGLLVKKQSLSWGHAVINLETEPSGIYIVSILYRNQETSTARIIKE